ncbi:MAG: GNAT family N-acetyltransferase [Bacilli bacterium]|nr:GNAT family N-acetyltransferase [Bacilli bacterium]
MIHTMKLFSSNFEDLIQGTKKREYRLNDEKRRKIRVGDTICFLSLPEKKQICYADVEKIEVFSNWEDCYGKYFEEDFKDTYESVEDVVSDTYHGYYSEEDTKKYGCLCITLKSIRNTYDERISFRLMKDTDYEMVYHWCNKPHVFEWFEQRKLSYEEIVSKYDSKINHSNQVVCIMEYDDQPIGLIQYYPYEEKYLDYHNPYEYDLFIGEEEYLSKGIGNSILQNMNDFLFYTMKADCIILRPMKRNERACRCYEKNGFCKKLEYEDTDTIGNKEVFVFYEKEL